MKKSILHVVAFAAVFLFVAACGTGQSADVPVVQSTPSPAVIAQINEEDPSQVCMVYPEWTAVEVANGMCLYEAADGTTFEAPKTGPAATPTLPTANLVPATNEPPSTPFPTATLEITPEIAQGVEEVPLQQMFNAAAFQPTSGVFPVVEVIVADSAWAQPGFVIPWPEHNLRSDGRQQAPMINQEKVWHGFEIRPGDALLFVSDGISTDAGSFTQPNGGWFRNETDHQITVYVQFGEVVILDAPNDDATMDAMARTMLKFVVSTNGLGEASYLGEIPLQ